MLLKKDEVLDRLATLGNVAQFVAFRPEGSCPSQSYCRVQAAAPNQRFANTREAITALLSRSVDGRVNVRSYLPENPRSREFIYGLESAEDVEAALNRLTLEGLHTIVNETIDINDGGVSGVAQGGVIEFSPDDTPRCVEKPGITSLSFDNGIALLETVYGFKPALPFGAGDRVEFSIHPEPRGWLQSQTLLWEHEANSYEEAKAAISWPNNFSRMIGDKAFGLLLAHTLGLPVPRTLVISRRVAPFEFGKNTGSTLCWTRTCPPEPRPGLYTTTKGWSDPFRLLAKEDPEHGSISSVLKQQAITAQYSGAAIATKNSELLLEGTVGEGDLFMLGSVGAEQLPDRVRHDVERLYGEIEDQVGPARFEWVHDGTRAWLVQMHKGASHSTAEVVVPGEAEFWASFEVSEGLTALRTKISCLPPRHGISVRGEFGMTSHIADVLRRAGIPARKESVEAK